MCFKVGSGLIEEGLAKFDELVWRHIVAFLESNKDGDQLAIGYHIEDDIIGIILSQAPDEDLLPFSEDDAWFFFKWRYSHDVKEQCIDLPNALEPISADIFPFLPSKAQFEVLQKNEHLLLLTIE